MDDSAGFAIGLILTLAIVLSLIAIAVNLSVLRSTIRGLLFPQGVALTVRACPHCRLQMNAEAVVCAFCGRESPPWEQRQGVWWRTADGGEEYFDHASGAWMRGPSSTEG